MITQGGIFPGGDGYPRARQKKPARQEYLDETPIIHGTLGLKVSGVGTEPGEGDADFHVPVCILQIVGMDPRKK